jgi:hypothetical protein
MEPDEITADPQKYLELDVRVDMIAYTLIMPPGPLKVVLEKKKYSINAIIEIEKLKKFEKSSVLQWITLNSLIPCHFAWVMCIRNIKDQPKINYDSCEYDQKNDPKYFDIDYILAIPDSAAAQALKIRKNVIKSVNKVTSINGIDYNCYAYYETKLKKIFVILYYLSLLLIMTDCWLLDGKNLTLMLFSRKKQMVPQPHEPPFSTFLLLSARVLYPRTRFAREPLGRLQGY